MANALTTPEKDQLLKIARQAITSVVNGATPDALDLKHFSITLQENGASFVTLTKHGALRGCIGTLEAYQPLVMDVQEHAIAAATQDYRFARVKPEELADLHIEISRLTPPSKLSYQEPHELITSLHPGVDGVILSDGSRRATFLPQVWEKLPDPEDFLSQLCLKMGAMPNLWQKRLLEVQTYQVEEFQEAQA